MILVCFITKDKAKTLFQLLQMLHLTHCNGSVHQLTRGTFMEIAENYHKSMTIQWQVNAKSIKNNEKWTINETLMKPLSCFIYFLIFAASVGIFLHFMISRRVGVEWGEVIRMTNPWKFMNIQENPWHIHENLWNLWQINDKSMTSQCTF